MEEIIDRVISYLQTAVPSILADINAHYATADTAKWGVPLTLAEPVEYSFGPKWNIPAFPALQVYIKSETLNNADFSMPTKEVYTLTVEVALPCDDSEAGLRMVKRYGQAIKMALRCNKRLTKADWTDPYAIDGYVKSVEYYTVTDKKMPLMTMIEVQAEYTFLSEKLEQVAGIYD
jgi:hypothetical protein